MNETNYKIRLPNGLFLHSIWPIDYSQWCYFPFLEDDLPIDSSFWVEENTPTDVIKILYMNDTISVYTQKINMEDVSNNPDPEMHSKIIKNFDKKYVKSYVFPDVPNDWTLLTEDDEVVWSPEEFKNNILEFHPKFKAFSVMNTSEQTYIQECALYQSTFRDFDNKVIACFMDQSRPLYDVYPAELFLDFDNICKRHAVDPETYQLTKLDIDPKLKDAVYRLTVFDENTLLIFRNYFAPNAVAYCSKFFSRKDIDDILNIDCTQYEW